MISYFAKSWFKEKYVFNIFKTFSAVYKNERIKHIYFLNVKAPDNYIDIRI
jgi:hypothetical protein